MVTKYGLIEKFPVLRSKSPSRCAGRDRQGAHRHRCRTALASFEDAAVAADTETFAGGAMPSHTGEQSTLRVVREV